MNKYICKKNNVISITHQFLCLHADAVWHFFSFPPPKVPAHTPESAEGTSGCRADAPYLVSFQPLRHVSASRQTPAPILESHRINLYTFSIATYTVTSPLCHWWLKEGLASVLLRFHLCWINKLWWNRQCTKRFYNKKPFHFYIYCLLLS